MSSDQPAGVDTIATLAYSELAAFERSAADAQFSPTVRDTVDLARIAGHSLGRFEQLAACIDKLGGDAIALMEAAQPSFAAFHERTKPKDWSESLMKSYVYDEIMKDFARAGLDRLDDDSRSVATAVLNDTRTADFLGARLGQAVSDDQVLGSRLALWGRKLVAETLRRVHEMPGIMPDDADAAAQLTQHVLANHSRRMSALGLAA